MRTYDKIKQKQAKDMKFASLQHKIKGAFYGVTKLCH